MSGIPMRLDQREEWPDDVPPGTFDVEQHGLVDRPSVTAHIIFVCPRAQRCAVLLGATFEGKRHEKDLCVWAWNGSVERPSLTPSINCVQKHDPETGKPTGGCGWHGFITNGELVG